MTEVLIHAAPALQIHAGPDALAELRDGGLRASRVRVLVGASGGPKWFVLHGLDRVLFPWLGALEGRAQLLGVGLAALVNALDRRALAATLERVVFDAGGDPGPFAPWRMLPTRHVALTAGNVRQALAASGAIPGVMSGVRDIPDAPLGTYRDGGVADYHFGAEIDPQDGLALYPHFYAELVPGWFDKALP